MFVTPAYAQAAAGGGGGGIEAFLPLILIFVVFYFLLIRPQQKKMKDHKAMLTSIRRGDKVVTGGGIIGTVSKVVDDNEVVVEVADEVKVRVQRSLISAVLSKPEPANEDKKPADSGSQGKSDGSVLSGLSGLLGGLFGGKKK